MRIYLILFLALLSMMSSKAQNFRTAISLVLFSVEKVTIPSNLNLGSNSLQRDFGNKDIFDKVLLEFEDDKPPQFIILLF